jgi:hypothetical protein
VLNRAGIEIFVAWFAQTKTKKGRPFDRPS